MGNMIGWVVTLGFWVVAAINVFSPLGAAATWINWIAVILLVAHAGECVYFRKQVIADPKYPTVIGFVIVLLVGVLYTGQWLNKKEA